MTLLRDNNARFRHLLTLAEEYFEAGDLSASARLAQIAARFSFPANAGLFGSLRLEKLLLNVGKQIPATDVFCKSPCGDDNVRHILHVLSYAKPIGGDSRFVWRWIQQDRSSRHYVAITTQDDIKGIYHVPDALIKSANNSGGFLRTLRAPTSQPLEQARELRMLCQQVDIVVLHLYPYDVIPVLALATGCESVKTLFINHSDHTFWIGASVANLVVHLRRQSQEFLSKRRGLRTEDSSILPIPLVYSPPSITRTQAKRELGYDPDVVLLLTIASPFKYGASGQICFLDLVNPVLAKLPQTVLIAVGPERKGAWRSASIHTNGRVVPLGKRWDNDLLYAAADIYLDSVPFSSITSLLEAGSHGVPLLGYSSLNSELGLLGPGAPGLDGTMQLANDPVCYQALLTRLITDLEFRHVSGQRTQTNIFSLHMGRNWTEQAHELYAKAERCADRNCLTGNHESISTSPLHIALVTLYGKARFSGRQLIGEYIGSLPYYTRLSITWRLFLGGFDLCLLNLLPPPTDTVIRHVMRRAKAIIGRFLRACLSTAANTRSPTPRCRIPAVVEGNARNNDPADNARTKCIVPAERRV